MGKGWGGVVLLFSLTGDNFKDFTGTNSVPVTEMIISCRLLINIKYFLSVKMGTVFIKIYLHYLLSGLKV